VTDISPPEHFPHNPNHKPNSNSKPNPNTNPKTTDPALTQTVLIPLLT